MQSKYSNSHSKVLDFLENCITALETDLIDIKTQDKYSQSINNNDSFEICERKSCVTTTTTTTTTATTTPAPLIQAKDHQKSDAAMLPSAAIGSPGYCDCRIRIDGD